MLIRAATEDDWQRIWPFLRRIVAAGDTYTWETAITEHQARDRWLRWHGRADGHTVVAVAPDGAVMGTAQTGPDQDGPGDHIFGASFMVDPAHSGRGVGRALGEHVLELARASGARGMRFNAVVETNTAAVRLWRSLGFEVIGTVPAAFRHPEHGYVALLVMFRPL